MDMALKKILNRASRTRKKAVAKPKRPYVPQDILQGSPLTPSGDPCL